MADQYELPRWQLQQEQRQQLQRQLANYPDGWKQQLDSVWLPLAQHIEKQIRSGRCVIGLHGGQGSGKSTLAAALTTILKTVSGLNIVAISLDDFYLTKRQRQALSESTHPLLKTRGVPGTHDTSLMQQALTELSRHFIDSDSASLTCNPITTLPQFDKLADDRHPESRQISGPVSAIILEGWCVGVTPEPDVALQSPINDLERLDDPDATWRRWVNQQLIERYQSIFDRLDYLVMLKVPGIKHIIQWRTEQEEHTRRLSCSSTQNGHRNGLRADEIERFVQHYQRLTQHALNTLPDSADIVIELNAQHAVDHIRCSDGDL